MLKLKFGNHKLGDDTAIFNMSSVENCPAKKKGLCNVINKGIRCYAGKAEQQYKDAVIAYRNRQESNWRTRSGSEILTDFFNQIKRRRKTTSYLRFNESGDFHSQDCIIKLSYITDGLKTIGVTTYGYTARYDLDFRKATFLVKGSGHDKGNNGRTEVILKDESIPEGYIECPGSCKKCNLCKIDTKLNIAFRKH